jgi:hypothetical protein
LSLACGNCGQPMAVLQLQGHYGRQVEVDLCAPCHLVWFDPVESARLAGPGLLALIGHMAQAQTLAHTSARPGMHCPHCRGPLHTVHNRTRWGPSLQQECAAGHGAWQTFGQYLSEKGLLRPMSSADRARAHAGGATPHCINCGGTLAAADDSCSWCGSTRALVDVARLARALDPEAATAGHPVHGMATAHTTLQCMACGAAQAADSGWQCVQCQATLTAPGLAQAHREVSALAPALQAHATRPAPHVVQQRLAAQQPALDRQRERARALQAEADQQMGREAPAERDPQALLGALGQPFTEWPHWAQGVAVAGAVLLGLWLS